MTDRILTLHPQGKTGVSINRDKYDQVRRAIVDVAAAEVEVLFKDLARLVLEQLGGEFDGSVGWYTTTVKLDLEARGELERVPKSSPQRLRLPGTAGG